MLTTNVGVLIFLLIALAIIIVGLLLNEELPFGQIEESLAYSSTDSTDEETANELPQKRSAKQCKPDVQCVVHKRTHGRPRRIAQQKKIMGDHGIQPPRYRRKRW